ncbi:MAG: helix-turn-helix transcriptional regulator [Bacteroidota bacterium]
MSDSLKNKIKVFRAMHNLTQADLAMKVNVTRKSINAIEGGRFVPSTVLALKIARIFNASVEEVFQLQEEATPESNPSSTS